MPYCEQCGKKISENAKFCRDCGEKVKAIKGVSKRDKSGARDPGPGARSAPHPKSKETGGEGERKKTEKPESKTYKLASIGSIITAAGSLLLGIFFIIYMRGIDLDETTLRDLLAISSFLLAIGIILTETWFLELADNNNNKSGKVIFAIAFIAGTFWFLLTFVVLYLDIIDLGTVFIVTLILSSIFTGIVQIVHGIVIRVPGENVTSLKLTQIYPPVSMLAGICFLSIVLVIYFGIALFLMAAAHILLAILFLKEK